LASRRAAERLMLEGRVVVNYLPAHDRVEKALGRPIERLRIAEIEAPEQTRPWSTTVTCRPVAAR